MPQVGIIGGDVGVTTGLAWGRFNPDLRDRVGLWKALARGRGVGWAQVGEKGEDIEARALKTATAIMNIIADWNLSGLGVSDVYIILEDFQVRKDLLGGSAKDKLAPVYVAGYVKGVLSGSGWIRCVRMVSPSMSKNKANDERLKYWAQLSHGRGGWIKGKQHTRDAFRLIAVGLDKEVP